MKFKFVFVALSLSFMSMACSSKAPVTSMPVKNSQAAAVATNAIAKPSPSRFYYADVQILTETSPEGNCPDEKKISEDLHLDPLVNLDEQSELKLAEGSRFKFFATNVNLEAMGFDSAKYSFSSLDGVVPRSIPFGLRLRRTPGQILELRFLDQVVEMKLLTTPVYSFSATETRGECTIKHNVNVFTERVGYFKKSGGDESPQKP